jgi:hypothetical protein
MISKILYQDPLLVEVKIIEVSPAIEVEIPFPVGDLRRISQCAGREVIWEAEHLRPYGAMSEEPLETLGRPPTPVPEDVMKSCSLWRREWLLHLLTQTPRCLGVPELESSRNAPQKGYGMGSSSPIAFS